MRRPELNAAIRVAKGIQESVNAVLGPPSETRAPPQQPVLPHALFLKTKGYIEKIVFQVNASYTATCYDACAVMVRRLVEVLIIEVYECHGKGAAIKDADGNYFFLERLVTRIISQDDWALGRETKKSLKRLKSIGDLSAHSRHYNAHRQYIEDEIQGLRAACEDLLYHAGLKT